MSRQLTLVMLCLFTCCALAPCAWGDPAPAGDAAGGKLAVRTIPLHNMSVSEFLQLMKSKPKATEHALPNPPGQPAEKSGSLTEYIPAGIQSIIGLNALNSLLVRAKSDEDIDQLQSLINLFDQPRISVLVEVLFIKSTVPLGELAQKSWYLRGAPAQFLDDYITQKKVAILNVSGLMIQNGNTGAFTTGDKESGITAIEVNKLTVHPDDTAEMDLSLRIPFIGNVTTLTMRTKNGEAFVVRLGEQSTAEKATCYAIITPTILKQDATGFGGMKNLPPLF